MLFRSVENQIVSRTLPGTIEELSKWDDDSVLPSEQVYYQLAKDLKIAVENRYTIRLQAQLQIVDITFRKTGKC